MSASHSQATAGASCSVGIHGNNPKHCDTQLSDCAQVSGMHCCAASSGAWRRHLVFLHPLCSASKTSQAQALLAVRQPPLWLRVLACPRLPSHWKWLRLACQHLRRCPLSSRKEWCRVSSQQRRWSCFRGSRCWPCCSACTSCMCLTPTEQSSEVCSELRCSLTACAAPTHSRGCCFCVCAALPLNRAGLWDSMAVLLLRVWHPQSTEVD